MNNRILSLASVSLVLAVSAIGCGDTKPASGAGGATSPTSGRVVANASAITAIADARCNLEQACGNIGANRDYPTRDACVSAVTNDMKDGLNDAKCPTGVDGSDLDACTAAIAAQKCGSPVDSFGSMAQCRTADLCID